MSAQGLAGFVLLVVAVLLANLPFASSRVLGILRRPQGKPPALRFAELAVCYGLMLLLARLVESRFVPPQPQGWEFYGITACLFVVLAYPGFVWRYLARHRERPHAPGEPRA